MAESLADIYARKDFSQPPEVVAIKRYVQEHFESDCEVALRQFEIIITVNSASLAGTLRMHLHKMQALLQTKKRLILRIRG